MSLADWLECLASKPRDAPVSTSLVPIQQTHATSTLESKLCTHIFTEGTVTPESSPSPVFPENTESFGQNFKIVAFVSLFWFWFLCGSLGISAVPGWFCGSQ